MSVDIVQYPNDVNYFFPYDQRTSLIYLGGFSISDSDFFDMHVKKSENQVDFFYVCPIEFLVEDL